MLDAIKDFVSLKLGIKKSLLTEQTKIEDDVCIAGLDTWTFYEYFFTEFEISNPPDFDLDRYASPEMVLDLKKLFKQLLSKSYRERTRRKNVTLKHLAVVALTKKWTEEIPESTVSDWH